MYHPLSEQMVPDSRRVREKAGLMPVVGRKSLHARFIGMEKAIALLVSNLEMLCALGFCEIGG